jgi:hypothetical protein
MTVNIKTTTSRSRTTRAIMMAVPTTMLIISSVFGTPSASAAPGHDPRQPFAVDSSPRPISDKNVATSMVTAAEVAESATLTRSEVLARARSWVEVNVKYTQHSTYTNEYGTYRKDCSGFVSMAWGLTPTGMSSPTTSTLPSYSQLLPSLDDLKPGDAINQAGTHVVLFVDWTDSTRIAARVYEETSYTDDWGPEPGTITSTYSRSKLLNEGYRPLRYNNIVDDAPPTAGSDALTESKSVVYQPNTKTTEYFARGTDGSLIHNYNIDNGGWSGWSSIQSGWKIAGNPTAVYQPHTGATEVFARGTDNKLIHTYSINGGPWAAWSAIQDWTMASDPTAVYQPNTMTTEVFARGGDNKLIHTYNTNNTGWKPWSALGAWTMAGNPTVIYQPGTKTTEVFARGADGKLIHAYNTDNAGWSAWSAIHDWTMAGDPQVIFQPHTGATEVFARGGDGKVIHTYSVNGGAWAAWSVLGNWAIAGNPAIVYQPNTKTTEVFGRGTDGKLIHSYNTDNTGWSAWSAIHDWTMAGDPRVVYQPHTGATEVFGRGGDGSPIHTYSVNGGAWAAWSVLGTWKIAE